MYKKAAGLAAKRGYTNIQMFRDGIPAWVKAGFPLASENPLPKASIPSVPADELNGMLARVTVLDIRTPSLYEMGSVAGSVKIPLAALTSAYAQLPKDRKVVVVDHSGKQVTIAARFLHAKGYDVSRLQGGLMSWVKAGLALEK